MMKKLLFVVYILLSYMVLSEQELYRNNNIKYDGEMKEGKYEGYGKYFYPEGKLVYEGEFKNGNFNGYGKYFYRDGTLKYEGYWKDDRFNGKGRVNYGKDNFREGIFEDGIFITGKVKEKPIGYLITIRDKNYRGVFKDYDGYYEGDYKDCKFEGKGKFYIDDGRVILSVYRDWETPL